MDTRVAFRVGDEELCGRLCVKYLGVTQTLSSTSVRILQEYLRNLQPSRPQLVTSWQMLEDRLRPSADFR